MGKGLDVKTAMEYLRNEEPELFPEDEQPETVREASQIRDQIKKLHDRPEIEAPSDIATVGPRFCKNTYGLYHGPHEQAHR